MTSATRRLSLDTALVDERRFSESSVIITGCQVWTGFHSYAEPGTGERLVDEAVQMLQELAARETGP